MMPAPEDFSRMARRCRSVLLDDVIPFWEKHSVDREFGGFLTCLGRDGTVYDTDKFIWLQARQVWMFSTLFSRLEKRDSWLNVARHGAEFLLRHGHDEGGDWYFSLDRRGGPLVQPYSIFSDCFAATAFSQFALAAGDDHARNVAERTYANILGRRGNPKGRFSKAIPSTRPMVSLALPMILANVTQELEWMLEPEKFDRTLDACVEEVFSPFLDKDRQVLHEHAAPDGRKLDSFEGRLLNPGHGIEAMGFIMDIAERRGDRALAEKAVEVVLRTLELGWDKEMGGIFYFLDSKGSPPQQLEWDQKLWWVHVEAMVSLLKGFRLTGREECWSWYDKVSAYAWGHFPDPEFGEWYGYLNRRGEVLLPLKGGKWKGCFHLPRGLYLCMREFEKLSEGAKPRDLP